jgi:hypothetical protein
VSGDQRVASLLANSGNCDCHLIADKVAAIYPAKPSTSDGTGDSGLFAGNVNDERYFPFTGAGAISVWSVSLPTDFAAFDYSTISDVILRIDYTAQDGGEPLKDQVIRESKKAGPEGP